MRAIAKRRRCARMPKPRRLRPRRLEVPVPIRDAGSERQAAAGLRRPLLQVHDDRDLRPVPQAHDAAVLVIEDLVGLRKLVLPKQLAHRALRLGAGGPPLARLLAAHTPEPEAARSTRGL